MQSSSDKRAVRFIQLALVLGTAIAYSGLLGAGFINFDDPDYITKNFHVNRGLSLANAAWAFTSGHAANWHPVTWLSHMLDCQIFGLNATAAHVENVLFHVANALLLFRLWRTMTGATWRSGVVAALFAWHPLHVESVAWVSERKDVLSTFFWLLSALAYVRYAEIKNEELKIKIGEEEGREGRKRWWYYRAALGFFALGLMSKPMVVTLPFVLLLLDYWPLNRSEESRVKSDTGIGDCRLQNRDLGRRPGKEKSAEDAGTAEVRGAVECTPFGAMGIRKWSVGGWGRLVLEKVPFLVLAMAVSVIEFLVQKNSGTMGYMSETTFHQRTGNALISCVSYLGKMAWPAHLAILYLHLRRWPGWEVALAGALLLTVTTVALAAGRRRPYLPVGWLWYLGMLVPVIGLVQVGMQSMADRYTYLSLVGIFVIGAWGAADLMEGRPRGFRTALAGGTVLALAACVVLTWKQTRYWTNSLTLFGHAVKEMPDNFMARDDLGGALLEENQLDEAGRQFETSERLEPQDYVAIYNLGRISLRRNEDAEAFDLFEKALRKDPDFTFARFDLAGILVTQERFDDACEQYAICVDEKPNQPEIRCNYAIALGRLGRLQEAADQYREALRLEPDFPEALSDLGEVLIKLGDVNGAIHELSEALRVRKDFAVAEDRMGIALQKLGQADQARLYYARAVEHDPTLAHARFKLGLLLGEAGDLEAARLQFVKVTELEPTNDVAFYDLGGIYEANGKHGEAADAFGAAAKLQPGDATIRLRLAGALAGAGKYGEATAQYREATRLKRDWPEALCGLAGLLATCPETKWRDGAAAVSLAERARDLTGGKDPGVLAVLDQAYAEAGRWEDAIRTAEAEVVQARAAGQTAMAEAAANRLDRYRKTETNNEAK
jgi:tetratricopeptide (TPR) repeat protein